MLNDVLGFLFKKIVYICSIDGLLNKEKFSSNEWEKLQEIALRKLQDQDAMLVLDIDNYIGDHSMEEIETFQNKYKKPVYYLSELRKNL